jgi:hypothetical protein
LTVVCDTYSLRREAERLIDPARESSRDPLRRTAHGARRGRRRAALRRRRFGAEVPVALRRNGVEAIEELFNAADDAEMALLDELVERAGLGWKCRAQFDGCPCLYMNVGTARCWACGAAEIEGKEDRDG